LSEDDPHVATVTTLWKTADWHERETFDLFGVIFDVHPDLRASCSQRFRRTCIEKGLSAARLRAVQHELNRFGNSDLGFGIASSQNPNPNPKSQIEMSTAVENIPGLEVLDQSLESQMTLVDGAAASVDARRAPA
jgi:hypothetical protein